jgi:hypothetical protein
MSTIAPGEVGGLAHFDRAVQPFQPSVHPPIGIIEASELNRPLDVNADLAEALHQQSLVLVLRKNQRIRKRAKTFAHVPEDDVGRLLARHPEIRGRHLSAAFGNGVREAELTIQFERSCLHGQRARGRSRLRRLVDDADARAQARQPQGQHQARRAGADDEDIGVRHAF